MQENTRRQHRGIFLLFVLGEILAFGFITLLQFVDMRENLLGFILTLIAMHVGIVCFILSKRLYKTELNIRKHYLVEYGLLALYLPILILKIVGVHIPQNTKQIIVVAITVFSVIVSIINDIKLYKKLF